MVIGKGSIQTGSMTSEARFYLRRIFSLTAPFSRQPRLALSLQTTSFDFWGVIWENDMPDIRGRWGDDSHTLILFSVSYVENIKVFINTEVFRTL